MSERVLSQENQQRAQYYNLLADAFVAFMKPRWYSPRPSIGSIAEFCELQARARTALWASVFTQFHEAKEGAWEIRQSKWLVNLEPK